MTAIYNTTRKLSNTNTIKGSVMHATVIKLTELLYKENPQLQTKLLLSEINNLVKAMIKGRNDRKLLDVKQNVYAFGVQQTTLYGINSTITIHKVGPVIVLEITTHTGLAFKLTPTTRQTTVKAILELC